MSPLTPLDRALLDACDWYECSFGWRDPYSTRVYYADRAIVTARRDLANRLVRTGASVIVRRALRTASAMVARGTAVAA